MRPHIVVSHTRGPPIYPESRLENPNIQHFFLHFAFMRETQIELRADVCARGQVPGLVLAWGESAPHCAPLASAGAIKPTELSSPVLVWKGLATAPVSIQTAPVRSWR